jgi:hypothetical protein
MASLRTFGGLVGERDHAGEIAVAGEPTADRGGRLPGPGSAFQPGAGQPQLGDHGEDHSGPAAELGRGDHSAALCQAGTSGRTTLSWTCAASTGA